MLTSLLRCSWCLSIGAVLLLAQPVFLSATDRDALISLYNSTAGDSWTNKTGWKDEPTLADGFNSDPCVAPLWFGVTCTDGRVTKLDVEKNQLTGSIPVELADLSELVHLNLSWNQLSGSIPSELGNLSKLEKIYLSINKLTGSIPKELGNLSNLQEILVTANDLTGSIPSELGNLSKLQYLYLFMNELTGSIPSELGNLSNLEVLALYDNQLTGSIPPNLANLSNLTFLSLSINKLTGSIPSELSNLPLDILYLNNNQLTGSIPSGLGNLPLRYLRLGNNQLTGSIPKELGNLSKLKHLQLQENQLVGAIPPKLGNLSKLEKLYLHNNQLTGSIPSELANLSNLTDINLSNNQLYTDNNVLRAFITSESTVSDWESTQTLNSYFAQFADGDGLSSQIVLFNLNEEAASTGQIEIRDDSGDLLSVDLNGEIVSGQGEISVPAAGLLTLRTDGLGDLETGSVQVTVNRHVEGVVIFGGSMGLAGVGSSPKFPTGFVAPIQKSERREINTGIAFQSLSKEEGPLELTLLDHTGTTLATSSGMLTARGHDAMFVNEFIWGTTINLSEFTGTLLVTATKPVTGTVIQTRSGEFSTMPVAPMQTTETTGEQQLYFAQFVDGFFVDGQDIGVLASEILLLNLSGEKTATAQIILRDDNGAALTVDLNWETVVGEKEVEILPWGVKVLTTDGVGELVVGSVSVTSDQPLAGVIVFSGSAVGTAGVGSSAAYAKGFVAPMEANTGSSIRTGVAMMNLETEELPLTAELLGADGILLDTVNLTLPAQGHKAVYLDELGWSSSISGFFTDQVELPLGYERHNDYGHRVFEGILRVSTNGNISATVIQTRPGQFATMPVVANPVWFRDPQ